MKKGLIIKAISEYYFVIAQNKEYLCKAKGKFRLSSAPVVGDIVDILEDDINNEGRIEKVYKRKNELIRPRISNIDYLIIFVSKKNPNIDFLMIDKLISNVRNINVEPIIVVNKCDLDASKLEIDYTSIVSDVIYISVKGQSNIDKFITSLKPGNYVLAGPSGSGKSSFINYVSGLSLKTSNISSKLKRGKHTTRHTELINISNDIYIADTPGFQSLDIDKNIDENILSRIFFEEFDYVCKFSDCKHINEPNCAIKNLLSTSELSLNRYNNYLKIYESIKERRKKW